MPAPVFVQTDGVQIAQDRNLARRRIRWSRFSLPHDPTFTQSSTLIPIANSSAKPATSPDGDAVLAGSISVFDSWMLGVPPP